MSILIMLIITVNPEMISKILLENKNVFLMFIGKLPSCERKMCLEILEVSHTLHPLDVSHTLHPLTVTEMIKSVLNGNMRLNSNYYPHMCC